MSGVVEKMLAAFNREHSPDFPETAKGAMLAALDALAESVTPEMGEAALGEIAGYDAGPKNIGRALRAAILAAKG